MMDDYLVPADGGALTPQGPDHQGLPVSSDSMPDYWISPAGDFVGASPGRTGGVFGFPVEGVSVRDLQTKVIEPIASLFREEMFSRGVNKHHVAVAANWFVNNCQRPPTFQMKTHEYNLSGFQIVESDKIPLTNFLNYLDENNVPENVVRLFLSWYWRALPAILERWAQQNPAVPAGGTAINDLSDAEFKQVMKLQPKHQQQTKDHLRSMWGDHYSHRIQVASRYFAQLPAADREYFENTVCQGGILLGDTVEGIQYAYNEAVKQAKPNVTTDNLAGEIEAIENIMRTDRKRYNNDLALQERLRALYELRGN
ncbi:MAG: hypothetical protein HYZ18_04240 [Pseudogulbenkiania sp.]|nr:hypothetical protein [Pseudogulbenkiania sp.]